MCRGYLAPVKQRVLEPRLEQIDAARADARAGKCAIPPVQIDKHRGVRRRSSNVARGYHHLVLSQGDLVGRGGRVCLHV